MSSIAIGLLGYGTVGTGTADILRRNRRLIAERTGLDLVVTKALVKDRNEVSPLPDDIEIHTDPEAIFDDPDIRIVVEVMGGYEPARSFSIRAMEAGKHVVTANKACLAMHYRELLDASRNNGVHYAYEASVGGGIPIINVLRNSMNANRIKSIQGIINGTANYILTQMAETDMDFDTALRRAQQLGYAEADPTFDVEGIDAAHKIFILALLAWGVEIDFDGVFTDGISNIHPVDFDLAREMGHRIRLLAIARESNGRIDIRVHPTMVAQDNPLYHVSGVYNAIYIEDDALGHSMLYGQGAGKMPTGSAVVSDIVAIARDIAHGHQASPRPFGFEELRPAAMIPIDESQSSFYIRFTVTDRIGVMSEISSALSDNGISVASAIQKGRGDGDISIPFVVITHEANGAAIRRSVEAIESKGITTAPTVLIRVQE